MLRDKLRVCISSFTALSLYANFFFLPLLAAYGSLSYFVFFVSGKKERPFQKTQSTKEIKAPPSPTLHLPDPVSSADLKEQDEEDQEFGRSSVIRRSFGLRGSKKGSKEKRVSSVF